MGWFDRLLGRQKEQAHEAPMEEEQISEADRAEERVAEARDESLETEGRIPPGTG